MTVIPIGTDIDPEQEIKAIFTFKCQQRIYPQVCKGFLEALYMQLGGS